MLSHKLRLTIGALLVLACCALLACGQKGPLKPAGDKLATTATLASQRISTRAI